MACRDNTQVEDRVWNERNVRWWGLFSSALLLSHRLVCGKLRKMEPRIQIARLRYKRSFRCNAGPNGRGTTMCHTYSESATPPCGSMGAKHAEKTSLGLPSQLFPDAHRCFLRNTEAEPSKRSRTTLAARENKHMKVRII